MKKYCSCLVVKVTSSKSLREQQKKKVDCHDDDDRSYDDFDDD